MWVEDSFYVVRDFSNTKLFDTVIELHNFLKEYLGESCPTLETLEMIDIDGMEIEGCYFYKDHSEHWEEEEEI